MEEISPGRLLKGKSPRLLDEWQITQKLWDAVRFEVDHRDEMGQFILTGSAVPASHEHIHHTGTGRFSWILMRPMSLYESLDSTGEVSLEALFETPDQIEGDNPLDLNQLAFLVCRGGWPRATDLEGEVALEQAFDYYDAVVKSDISRADGITRNPERVKRLMRSYARNQGSQATNTLLKDDIMANDAESLDTDTVDLRVFADALNGKVYHFRDKTGLECDAVVHLRNGSYGLIEVKLGGDKLIEEGAENLKLLKDKIDITKMKAPSFLMVLIGVGDYAYRRPDGVYVVPIGCLKD